MKTKLLFICAWLFSAYTFAQQDSSDSKKLQLNGGVQFISNQTYAGRTDSLKLPVLIPGLKLVFQKTFYINTRAYFNLSSGKTSLDGVSIEPGYQFSKNNWDGSFSIIKNFISDSSNLIIAPVNASVEFYLGKETKLINPFIGSEYVFSNEGNDFIIYLGISKNVGFSKANSRIMVNAEPSLSSVAGTQNFYYSYLKSYSSNGNKGGGRTKGNSNAALSIPVIAQLVKLQSNSFSLLSTAIELPITASTNGFSFTISPSMEIPVNLISNEASGSQNSSSIIYITAGLLFDF